MPIPADGSPLSPVTWRVIAESDGKHDVIVTTDTSQLQSRRVTITAKCKVVLVE